MMPNLQALNVNCNDDSWKNMRLNEILQDSENDELIEWLHNELPLTFINRGYIFHGPVIQIWIK